MTTKKRRKASPFANTIEESPLASPAKLQKRRRTRIVEIGSLKVGGSYPISIQSMAKTNTEDINATVKQIKTLEKCGCEIVRVAVKNMNDASALNNIKTKIDIPLVADIHFDYRLALQALNHGVDGLRLNPGNIYRREEVEQVAEAAKKKRIPIRVGVNAGSLRSSKQKNSFPASGFRLADLMVKSALDYIKILEKCDFYDIIISLKASDVAQTVAAYRKLAKRCSYPFHLGITATGLAQEGVVKSAIGIGTLLLEGIGDTIRVSLAGDPLEEVKVGREILQALGLRNFGPEIIACPTCGRCQVDIVKIARQIKDKLKVERPFRIAIMGCEVNGPGEAREADIGVACGKNSAALFKKGRIVRRIKEKQIVDALIAEIVNTKLDLSARLRSKKCGGLKV